MQSCVGVYRGRPRSLLFGSRPRTVTEEEMAEVEVGENEEDLVEPRPLTAHRIKKLLYPYCNCTIGKKHDAFHSLNEWQLFSKPAQISGLLWNGEKSSGEVVEY